MPPRRTRSHGGSSSGSERLFTLDLHNHTYHSPDGVMSPRKLLECAAARGIDCLAVTDHGSLAGALECLALASARPGLPQVIPGEEIQTRDGEIVGLYLERPVPEGLSLGETVERIREQAAIMYLPHPFDRLRSSTIDPAARLEAARAADAVEVWNGRNLRPEYDRLALELAAELGKPLGAGSDAHYPGEVGRAYLLVPRLPVRDDLLSILRQARPGGASTSGYRLRTWSFVLRTGLRKLHSGPSRRLWGETKGV